MPKTVITRARLWVGQYSASADTDKATIVYDRAVKPCTVMEDGEWEKVALGIRKARASYEGFLDTDSADIDGDVMAAGLGATTPATSLVPHESDPAAVGDLAHLFRPRRSDLSIDLHHGELSRGQVAGTVNGAAARGRVLATKDTRTTSGTGSSFQLGAVAAGQKVYGACHVFTAGGTSPTLDVIARSDSASGMPSPTTRLTFPQFTASGDSWQELAGAIADDWWDIDWTIGGASPSFLFAVCLGIA